jgi:uncharacterized protein YciI
MPPVVPRPAQTCFAFTCFDGPEAPSLRVRDLEGHLAHIEANWERYLIAGPARDPEQPTINGSILLVFADSLDEAWSLMRGDPYFNNGQFARIDVRQFSPAVGLAIGGKTWTDVESVRPLAAGDVASAT